MKISGTKPGSWEVAVVLQGDLAELLNDGWEPYAVASHGGVIRHVLRRQVVVKFNP